MSTTNQISIDALNNHLFETIEMLKNNTDAQASENEKIDLDTAKTISDLAKNVIEGYKVKAQVLAIFAKCDNPNLLQTHSEQLGLTQHSA